MVGENLWVVITRAGAGLLDRVLELMQLPLAPDLLLVQSMAITLVVVQQLIYVLGSTRLGLLDLSPSPSSDS